jgi:DNA-binding CsgD family transcriptional regulator
MEIQAGSRLALLQTLTDLEYALTQLGEVRQASAAAHKAHSLAKLCGAVPPQPILAQRVAPATTAGSLVRGATATAALSDAERRVATLAAQGYTNQEISKWLHVTVSTVEQHLTRVYRKLKVGRAQLRLEVLAEQVPRSGTGAIGYPPHRRRSNA